MLSGVSHIALMMMGQYVYAPAQALEFKAASSQYGTITLTTSADWALSAWVKFPRVGTTEPILGTALYRNSSNQLVCGSLTTTAVFRDPTAFYGIEVYGDHLYVNGVDMGACSTAALTNPRLAHDGTNNADVVLADFAFRNGSTASLGGGQFNSDGIWVPKKPVGATHTAADWTLVNSPAGVSDVPGDKTSANLGNYARWNELDKSTGATLTLAGTRAAANTTGYRRGKATFGIESGKWVWACRVTHIGSYDYVITGIANPSFDVGANAMLGSATDSYGFMAEYKRTAGSNTALSTLGFVSTDLVAIAFDVDAGKLWFGRIPSVGGVITWYEGGDPAAGTGEQFASIPAGKWTPAYSVAASSSYQCTLHTDLSALGATPPIGFKSLCTAHLPTRTPKDPGAQIGVKLYTGNGTSQSIDLGFEPDFVWIKQRSGSVGLNHRLFDSLRGADNVLIPDSTNGEGAWIGDFTFDTGGFSVAPGQGLQLNTNGDPYVAWCIGGLTHMSAPEIAALVTATGATITPTKIDYDAALGFFMMTHTGTGAVGTLPNPCGITPGMLIHKRRNSAANWWITHKGLNGGAGLGKYRLRFDTAAQAADSSHWNNTAPTATLITVGSDAEVNSLNDTYVTYGFCDTDAIKVGSYIGNGNADGPFINLGFEPVLFMPKRVDSTGNWTLADGERCPNNPIDRYLFANLSIAEQNATMADFTAGGFKYRATAADWNASGGTYIYLALAKSYFGGKKLAQGRAR